MDFEVRVHRISQGLIPPKRNQGYPGMVVHYCRHAPAATDEHGNLKHPLEPDPRLIDAARWLGAMTDFIAIPSNFTHLFRELVEQASGMPVLDMIGLVVGEVQRRGWKSVGVLGFGLPTVYLQPLAAAGIGHEVVDEQRRMELDISIMAVMEGRTPSKQHLQECVIDLLGRGVDGVILGCTELPLILGDGATAPNLINPAELLAEAAVRRAME